MANLPSDEWFRRINRWVFRIEAACTGKTHSGTDFAIAKFNQGNRLILATAKHLLDVPNHETATWKIQRFDDRAQVIQEVAFGPGCKPDGEPSYRQSSGIDLGVFALPALDSAGRPFCTADEFPLPHIKPPSGAAPGTRVGWAGFPGTVKKFLGFPQLCYFEGAVSATVNRQDKQLYIVDGHNARGVSGGPVWRQSDLGGHPEIIGIVCAYGHGNDEMPGYCIFEPIHPAIYVVNGWRGQLSQGDDITFGRWHSPTLSTVHGKLAKRSGDSK